MNVSEFKASRRPITMSSRLLLSKQMESPSRRDGGWRFALTAPTVKAKSTSARRTGSKRGRSVSSQTTLLSDFAGRPLRPRGTTPTSTNPEEVKRAKRSLLRRAKGSERTFSKWLQDHDGPDPKYRHLTSSTGRIGHVTGLQADSVSIHYLAECKNVKVNATLAKWWQQINAKAVEWGKDPILLWEPSNADQYKVYGKPLPDMHIMTADRHAELLRKEKIADAQSGANAILGR